MTEPGKPQGRFGPRYLARLPKKPERSMKKSRDGVVFNETSSRDPFFFREFFYSVGMLDAGVLLTFVRGSRKEGKGPKRDEYVDTRREGREPKGAR